MFDANPIEKTCFQLVIITTILTRKLRTSRCLNQKNTCHRNRFSIQRKPLGRTSSFAGEIPFTGFFQAPADRILRIILEKSLRFADISQGMADIA